MFKFSTFSVDPIRIIIVVSWNLTVMIRSKSIPFRSIQGIKFNSVDTIHSLSRSNSRNSISSCDNTNKHVSSQPSSLSGGGPPSSISIKPRLPYTSIELSNLYPPRSLTSFQGRNSTTQRLLLSLSLEACRNINAEGFDPAPRRAMDRGSC